MKSILKKVIHNLFFNNLIESTIEGLFGLIIGGYLNIRTLDLSSFGEIIGAFLSFYYLFFSLFFIVICNLWVFITQNK